MLKHTHMRRLCRLSVSRDGWILCTTFRTLTPSGIGYTSFCSLSWVFTPICNNNIILQRRLWCCKCSWQLSAHNFDRRVRPILGNRECTRYSIFGHWTMFPVITDRTITAHVQKQLFISFRSKVLFRQFRQFPLPEAFSVKFCWIAQKTAILIISSACESTSHDCYIR